MTSHIWPYFLIAILLLLLYTGGDAFAESIRTDLFDYSTTQQMQAAWLVNSFGFAGPVAVDLEKTDTRQSVGALSLTTPPAGRITAGRIDIDTVSGVSFANLRQIVFWLYVDDPRGIAETGIHFGDTGFGNDFAKFNFVQLVKGWQQIFISADSLSADSGSPSWKAVSKMRITFWFTPGSGSNRVLIDDVQWLDQKKRSNNLHKTWYE